MYLVKKKVKGPDIGDIVEVEVSNLNKINKNYSITKQRIDTFDKFILINILNFKGQKFARIISVKTNYSQAYNYKVLKQKKDFILINYESLITSRSKITDVYPEINQQIFIKDNYGIKI